MSSSPDLFAPDFQEQPYWWDAAPRPQLAVNSLLPQVDVVIVGSGITGLNAARELVRGGRSVAVLDAEDAGYGASTRNMGFIGRVLKRSFSELMKQRGLACAIAYYQELRAAYDSVGTVIEAEKIDCNYRQCGRIAVARSGRQLDHMVEEYELKHRHLGDPYEVLDRDALVAEFNCSDDFIGGVYLPDLAGFHPGKYHAGLLDRAMESGAEIYPHTKVEALGEPGSDGLIDVMTSRGSLRARNVIVATNGYTDANLGWLRPRVIPFHAFALATEELSVNQLDTLMPNRRTYLDANFNVTAVQVTPDGRRILMSGLTGTDERTMQVKAQKLHKHFTGIFPQLGDIQLSRAWDGWCSAPLDRIPKLVHHKGVHYATGYTFMGMPMGTYLGQKAAWQVLGLDKGKTIFSDKSFVTSPFYTGNNWFVPYAMKIADLHARWVNR